jgi:tetratricopeptide (TPR) repeat protein
MRGQRGLYQGLHVGTRGHAESHPGGSIADFDRVLELALPGHGDVDDRGADRRIGGDRAGGIADAEVDNDRGDARPAVENQADGIAGRDRAIAPGPHGHGAYNDRGAARLAAGDLAGAVADFDRAIALDARCTAAYNSRGVARHSRGDLAGAIADFDCALLLDPLHAEACHNRGVARHVRGDLPGAIADLDRALRLNPLSADSYYNRGVARLAAGDTDGAIVDFDQALRIDPRHVSAYIGRGNARYHKRDLAGLADYWMAFLLAPQLVATKIIRKLASDLRSDPVAVLTNCDRHLRISPDDCVAFARRGLTLLLLGRDRDAEQDFDQFLLRSPDWKTYLELLIREAKQHRGDLPIHDLELRLRDRDLVRPKTRPMPALNAAR